MSTNRDLELLSAYADGELSEKEMLEIEQKLRLSPELQSELEKLYKLKNHVASSARQLPESPYFETRVMAAVHSEKTEHRSRRWIPAAAFGILTIFLMVFFKYNPDLINDIVKEQHSNLAALYKENLKPLLFAADLTNEDIFNFAFYHRLPLDKTENQMLQLGYSKDGKEFFEIKKSQPVLPENNYEKFMAVLNLNDREKEQMDSILESYKDELEMQILANEKNTIAINPNLWNYNKAIAADLISFAKEASVAELTKILPGNLPVYNKSNVRRIVSEIKSVRPAEFIFLTPDTIFSDEYAFDQQKLRQEIKKMKEDLKNADDEVRKSYAVSVKVNGKIAKMQKESPGNSNFNIYIDSNMCHVQLAGVNIPNIPIPDFNEMAGNIEEMTRHLQSAAVFPRSRNESRSFSIRIGSDSANGFNFDFNMPNLDSVTRHVPRQLDSMIRNYSKNFNGKLDKNLDSLVSNYNNKMNNSENMMQNEEFRKQMQDMQQEMMKFREEMENLRKDLKKDTNKQKPESKKGLII